MQHHQTSLYEIIGGERAVQNLVSRFYELMDRLPEAANCRAIHPPDLTGPQAKLFDYLTGWLGGPALYTDKYGHPRLRSRHFHASIGPQERDQWLLCFRLAMEETIAEDHIRKRIWEPVEKLANHMQNKE